MPTCKLRKFHKTKTKNGVETKRGPKVVRLSEAECSEQLGRLRLESQRERRQGYQKLLRKIELSSKLLQPEQLQWKNHHSQTAITIKSKSF